MAARWQPGVRCLLSAADSLFVLTARLHTFDSAINSNSHDPSCQSKENNLCVCVCENILHFIKNILLFHIISTKTLNDHLACTDMSVFFNINTLYKNKHKPICLQPDTLYDTLWNYNRSTATEQQELEHSSSKSSFADKPCAFTVRARPRVLFLI